MGGQDTYRSLELQGDVDLRHEYFTVNKVATVGRTLQAVDTG